MFDMGHIAVQDRTLWGKEIGDAEYRAEADLNHDGEINGGDYTLVLGTWGAALPAGLISNAGTGGPDNDIGYSGYVFMVEVGLYHVRFRTYDPILGRWLERDPIGYVDGMSLYLYCSASPLVFADPFGLFDGWTSFMGVVKAVGGVAETLAGASLTAASGAFGLASLPTGVGPVLGFAGSAAGVAVAGHGLDTLWSGLTQAYTGEQQDSLTSMGLQSLGMSQDNANLVDAGASVLGSLGAGLATGGLKTAAALRDPCAKGLSTLEVLKDVDKGSRALKNADFDALSAALGGQATSPLQKLAMMQSGKVPLSTGPFTNIGKSVDLFFRGTGLTAAAAYGAGGVGAAGGAARLGFGLFGTSLGNTSSSGGPSLAPLGAPCLRCH